VTDISKMDISVFTTDFSLMEKKWGACSQNISWACMGILSFKVLNLCWLKLEEKEWGKIRA
jgi:hypothetical protein